MPHTHFAVCLQSNSIVTGQPHERLHISCSSKPMDAPSKPYPLTSCIARFAVYLGTYLGIDLDPTSKLRRQPDSLPLPTQNLSRRSHGTGPPIASWIWYTIAPTFQSDTRVFDTIKCRAKREFASSWVFGQPQVPQVRTQDCSDFGLAKNSARQMKKPAL